LPLAGDSHPLVCWQVWNCTYDDKKCAAYERNRICNLAHLITEVAVGKIEHEKLEDAFLAALRSVDEVQQTDPMEDDEPAAEAAS
jgi:hypothetical protein